MASKNNTAGSSSSDQARERARQIADRQSRRSNGKPVGLIAAVIALLVIIALIIGVVVWQNNRARIPDAGPVPASANQYGGITVTKDGIVQNSSDVQERDLSQEPEPAATAAGLGGEERLEGALQHFRAHAAALVDHAELHVIATEHVAMALRIPLIERDVAHLQAQDAAVALHRVARIDYQIE